MPQNVDIIAQPFSMCPTGLGLKEKLVLLLAACPASPLKGFLGILFRLPVVLGFAFSPQELISLCSIYFPSH